MLNKIFDFIFKALVIIAGLIIALIVLGGMAMVVWSIYTGSHGAMAHFNF